MSDKYDVLYSFEYGEPDIPDRLEVRRRLDEGDFQVVHVQANGDDCWLATFHDLDDARDYLFGEVDRVIRGDKAADELERRNG